MRLQEIFYTVEFEISIKYLFFFSVYYKCVLRWDNEWELKWERKYEQADGTYVLHSLNLTLRYLLKRASTTQRSRQYIC